MSLSRVLNLNLSSSTLIFKLCFSKHWADLKPSLSGSTLITHSSGFKSGSILDINKSKIAINVIQPEPKMLLSCCSKKPDTEARVFNSYTNQTINFQDCRNISQFPDHTVIDTRQIFFSTIKECEFSKNCLELMLSCQKHLKVFFKTLIATIILYFLKINLKPNILLQSGINTMDRVFSGCKL